MTVEIEKEKNKEQLVQELDSLRQKVAALSQNAGLGVNGNGLQSLLDAIPNPVFYKDTEGVYRGCNTSFADAVLGVSRARIIGSTVYDLADEIPPEWAAVDQPKDLALLLEPGTEAYEGSLRFADGSFRTVMIHKRTLFDADGRIAGVVSVLVDLTETKKLEERSKMLLELTQAAIAETEVLYQLSSSLIAFGDLAARSSFLTLPHPRAHLRRFVLAPLAEIAPDLVLPLQREPVRTLLAKCPASQWVEKVG